MNRRELLLTGLGLVTTRAASWMPKGSLLVLAEPVVVKEETFRRAARFPPTVADDAWVEGPEWMTFQGWFRVDPPPPPGIVLRGVV